MIRRDFLKYVLFSSLLSACTRAPCTPRIGLALGGGGAKGLAHVLMLEVFDELGVAPYRIAGTSIGAVMGSLYASGMSGRAIRHLIDQLTVSDEESWLGSLFSEEISRWLDFIDLKLGNGSLADSSAFIRYLGETIGLSDFSELKIPLKVVATDFWSREQVVFDKGELLPAIQASMAVPGLFEPVNYAGRVLVDGGLVNPVPYDLLLDECDVLIAVDVLGTRTPEGSKGPGFFETTFNTFQIMQSSIMREKRERHAPDLYLQPAIENVRVLDFYKVEKIYRQAMPAAGELRSVLRRRISA